MKSTIIKRVDRLATRIRSFGTATDGNVAIIFGLALLTVVGVLGIGIDYARGNRVRSELQTALDAAVLAAAKQPTGQATTAGSVFSANFGNACFVQPPGTTQPVTPPPGTPVCTFAANGDGSVSGTANTTVPTSILQILHAPPMQVSATATAAMATANVCILNEAPDPWSLAPGSLFKIR